MATKATSIPAADLAKLTQAAVKTVSGTTRIVKGPLIWGYILAEKNMDKQLALASAVTTELAAGAKAAGIGLRAQPTVILKPGKIIAGYIATELNIPVLQ